MADLAENIGVKFTLEGEAEFKKALTGIDEQLRVVSSSLELTSTKFAGQESSIEKLTAKQKGLQSVYDKQSEKVDTLRAAVEKMSAQYGEADTRTASWQVKLNKAETALEKTRQEMDSTSKSLAEMTEATKKTDAKMTGLGDVLNQVGSKFGISLPSEMTNTINGMVNVDLKTVALVGGFAALAAVIVSVEKALIDMTNEAAAYVDEILTTATVTSMSTKALQEYAYAAELMDVSVETITGSQTKLIRSMGSAQEGTKAQTDAFNRLHVEYQNVDGSLRDAEAVFWDVVTALGHISNETERDAIAMDLLGKSARDLNPLIALGAEGMTELAKEARDVGYVLDNQALGALGDVDDAMQRLNRTTEASHRNLAAQFAPAMASATEKLTQFVGDLGKKIADTGIVTAFGSLLESVAGLLEPAMKLINVVLPGMDDGVSKLAYTLAIVADTLSMIVGFVQILTLDFGGGWDTITTAMGLRTGSGKLSAQQKLQYKDALNTSVYDPELGAWVGNVSKNATGNDNWRGGVTWVGENGPEQVYLPQGAQILNAQESRATGGDVFNITISAASVREFNDIVEVAKTARMNARKGVAVG